MLRIPSFATERLIVRPPAPGDLEEIVALGADAEVMRFLRGGQSRAQASYWLECMLADGRYGSGVAGQENLPGWMVVVERESQAFVGLVVLKVLRDVYVEAIGRERCPFPSVEVGYRLARSQWGKGYATEAGAVMVKYAFETLGLKQVSGIANVRNGGSCRVLEKLGLVREGEIVVEGEEIAFFTRRV